MSTPGRNDPCPCGSGRKFKHCCLRAGRGDAESSPSTEFSVHLREAIGNHEFDGLSPHAVHRILHAPFDSPDVLTIAERLDGEPRAL